MSGDQLLGIAAIITAIAALVTAWFNRTRIVNARTRIETNLGPPTQDVPESVRELLVEIRAITLYLHEQWPYQHTRNHDILAAITGLATAVPLLTEVAIELLAELRKVKE